MSEYIEFVTEELAPLGQITSRKMFGGYCLYCDGIVFGVVADDTLYLKVDDENRPEFEQASLPLFQPFPDKPDQIMQYCLAPPEMFEDPDELLRWAGGAVQAGRRAQRKKRPKKKGSPSPRRA